MAEVGQKLGLIISQKQGLPVYASNPSVPNAEEIGKRKAVRFGDDKKGFILDQGSGEILAGGASFYEFEEVDNARFVKIYLAGVKQAAGLSKAGLALFEIVYSAIQAKPNTDEIGISFYTAARQIEGLSERTYRRGLRELCEKEFLYRSPVDGVFFINVRFLFNGDRLGFVKGYRRKTPPIPAQRQLALDEPKTS